MSDNIKAMRNKLAKLDFTQHRSIIKLNHYLTLDWFMSEALPQGCLVAKFDYHHHGLTHDRYLEARDIQGIAKELAACSEEFFKSLSFSVWSEIWDAAGL